MLFFIFCKYINDLYGKIIASGDFMNISNALLKRNAMFSLISAIETDIRKNICDLTNEGLEISLDVIAKLKERYNLDKGCISDDVSILIDYLDMGDYVQILNSNNTLFPNKTVLKKLTFAIENIIPTRNRIMHVRPLEFDDDSKIFDFVKDIGKFSEILEFCETKTISNKIESNPDFLLSVIPKISVVDNSNVKNNLPMVDYDDTGFVGRIKDKELLTKKILGPYPVISVIGVGGIGKTSLVLSTLYDLLDNEQKFSDMFDSIIWVTLKTKSMTDGDFVVINKAITNFDENIKNVSKYLTDVKASKIDELIDYMSNNKTLLVIDNLETLDDEKKEFNRIFDELPSGSKILITSRIGIGNYEQAYRLEKLSEKDALVYFRKVSNIYKVKPLIKQNDNQIKKYLELLDFNPLAIKWFVINVGKGETPESIVNNGINDLSDFCLSNIYEKLSDNSKYLLRIIMIKHNRCSFAELMYLCELSYDECMESIHELMKSNFLVHNEDFSYSVIDFAVTYIQNIKGYNNRETDKKIQNSINILNGKLENLKNDIQMKNEFHPLTISPQTENEKIATLYVLAAIKSSKAKKYNEVDIYLNSAQNSSKNFADIYKIAGYLYSSYDSIKSEENYKTAINLAENKAPVHYFYAGSLINNQKYDMAEYELKEALNLEPENKLILMSNARLLKMTKKYSESLEILEKLNIKKGDENIEERMYRIYLFEMIDTRVRYIDYLYRVDNDKAYNLIIKTIKFLDSLDSTEFDFTIYNTIFKLAHIYIKLLSSSQIDLKNFMDFLFKYQPYILAVKKGHKKEKNFNDDLNELLDKITKKDAKKINDILNYEATIKEENVGYIFSLKEAGYGFIRPVSYSYQTIYFHSSQFVGDFRLLNKNDRVLFKLSITNDRLQAMNVRLADKIENIEEKLIEDIEEISNNVTVEV